jgi:thioredoxin-dependent peroxiredoxin
MIKPDERAPEFTLPDDTGKDRSLTELLSGGAIVLYFYPADFTPGCTRQACALRDVHGEIQSAGLRVVGISPQSPESHAKFKAKHQLPFVLLSDEQKTVVKMYGVNGPLGLGVRRATFLIDAGRRIRDAVLADFRIGRHQEFVQKAILLRATAAPAPTMGSPAAGQ